MGLVTRIGYPIDVSAYFLLVSEPQNSQSRDITTANFSRAVEAIPIGARAARAKQAELRRLALPAPAYRSYTAKTLSPGGDAPVIDFIRVAALQPRLTKNRKQQQWQGRQQCFWWVNHITYSYDKDQHTLPVHVVGCEETWLEVDPDNGELITKQSRHVWISSHPLPHDNVHERGNLGARRRWGIELSIQIEKCHGYHYEHLFSHDWKALKGFHYLLRLAHLVNALAQGTRRVAQQVLTLGVQAFLRFVRETCANRWLRYEWIQQLLATPFQLRLE